MIEITDVQYEYALARIEELLPMVDDSTSANDKNAVELLKKAAEQEHVKAMYVLGLCYDNGTGTRKNIKKAIDFCLIRAIIVFIIE